MWAKYLIAYLGPLSMVLALKFQSTWVWSPLILLFVILPAIEAILPLYARQISSTVAQQIRSRKAYDWILYGNVLIIWVLVIWYGSVISTIDLTLYEYAGLTISLGIIMGGFGINVAHELGHRSSKWDQIMSQLLLLPALFMRFTLEHNFGHHKYVATDRDPASAGRGLTLYKFIPRSFIGTYRGAFQIAQRRLQRSGRNNWLINNAVIHYELIQWIYLLSMGWFFGWMVIPFLVGAALIAIGLLEAVNYIEHYGLRRKIHSNGKFEKVNAQHAWNSNHLLSRLFLYELSLHPDHHQRADKKYQILEHTADSPQMPQGYPFMIIAAFFPSFYFRMVQPELERIEKNDTHT